MTTTNETLEKVLDNAFIIKREGTKHKNEFKMNGFERPITHNCFFQLLDNSNIILSNNRLGLYMCHIKATDYIRHWKTDAKLVVYVGYACIEVKGAEYLNIRLDRDKLNELYSWFKDESLFYTDFADLKHNPKYYLND